MLRLASELKALPHCLIYGAAKSGKTRTIATCPAPVVLDCDCGLSVLRDFPVKIPYEDGRTVAQINEFVKAIEGRSAMFKPFYTIVFDDLTELADIWVREERPKHKDPRNAYYLLEDYLLGLIRSLRQLDDKAVVFLAKEEKVSDPVTGVPMRGPWIAGKKVGPMMPYLVGEVYHLESWVDPTTSIAHDVFRTKRSNSVDAGSRSGKLNEIEFANLEAIFRKVLS